MSLRRAIDLLVMQSTGFCNIDCDYCYLPNRDRKSAMHRDVLKRVQQEIIESPYWNESSLLLWHAGEPLTLGCDWYSTAHDVLRADRLRRIQFQSNGMLINDQWVSLFRASGAGVGLSIDGPEWIHDRHRVDRSGRGSFSRALAGADLLKRNGIPFTNIATLTKDSIDHPNEILDFFLDLRPARLAFNVEEAEGSNDKSSLYGESELSRIRNFFQVIANRAFKEALPFRIREVESAVSGLFRPSSDDRSSQETELGRIISVAANGDVALFSPELLTSYGDDPKRSLAVGNILKASIDEIIDNQIAKRQQLEVAAGVRKCKESCTFFQFCLGGSPANKHFEHGRFDVAETWHCRTSKQAVTAGILSAVVECGTPMAAQTTS